MTLVAPFSESLDHALPDKPYPGLRAFEKEEWPIFFGRERMMSEVVSRVLEHQLVVVHGSSGCGKSSLIRAGVLPELEIEHSELGKQWRTVITRPSYGPIDGLARAMADLVEAGSREPERIEEDLAEILSSGREAAPRLADYLRRNENDYVCVLIDQFEELFAHAKRVSRAEAIVLTDVLVGLQQHRPEGLHFILTMRSEFLGECGRFDRFAQTVNATQYLLPEMERADLLRAICHPAELFNGHVSEKLAVRMIRETEGRQDELPLIQHGLMLMSQDKLERTDHAEEDGSIAGFKAWNLDLRDYSERGGLTQILSDHADRVFETALQQNLGPGGAVVGQERIRVLLAHTFRALTDVNAEGQAIRRPRAFGELCRICGAKGPFLARLLAPFRADGVSFLVPYEPAELTDDSIVDISHEALIRCWGLIAKEETGWLAQEFEAGLRWRTLVHQARRSGPGATRAPLSASATEDLQAFLPSLPSSAWADRYGGGYGDVRSLLELSRRVNSQAQRRKDAVIKWGGLSLALVATAFAAISAFQWRQATNSREVALNVAKIARQNAESARRSLGRAVAARRAMRKALRRARESEARARESEARARRALVKAGRAELEAEKQALLARKAEKEAINAAKGQSLLWARQARTQLKKNLPSLAANIALAGLPANPDNAERPWVAQLAGVLIEALSRIQAASARPIRPVAVNAAAFSPDGRRLVFGGRDGRVRLNDARSGAVLWTRSGHHTAVSSLAFSPDGRRLAFGAGDGVVQVWDANRGRPLWKRQGHRGTVTSVAVSPDGKRVVSAGSAGRLRLWDAVRGTPLKDLKGQTGAASSVAFSPDGKRLASAGSGETLRLWNLEFDGKFEELHGHVSAVKSVAFSPDGRRLVSGDNDETVLLWDARSGKLLRRLSGDKARVYAVGFSPDGKRVLAAGGKNRTARLWDAETGRTLVALKNHKSEVRSVVFSPDGRRFVSADRDGNVKTWPRRRGYGRQNPRISGPVGFSSDGRLAASNGSRGSGGTIRLWNAQSGRELRDLKTGQSRLTKFALSPDGKRLASGGADGTVRILNVATGRPLYQMKGHRASVTSIAFSLDGRRVVSGGYDKSVGLWDAVKGQQLWRVASRQSFVYAVAASSDGKLVASGGFDGTVRLWGAAGGRALRVFKGRQSVVMSVAISPDSKRVASGGRDGTVRIWDIASGRQILNLKGHKDGAVSVGYSPDGKRVVAGDNSSTVRIWDVESGEELIQFRGIQGGATYAEFLSDGRRVAFGGAGAFAIAFVGRTREDLLKYARSRVPGRLTTEQRKQFLLPAN
ncbi:MAG: hypothetical protein AAF441_00060 [Pseudomonadota bacterium]